MLITLNKNVEDFPGNRDFSPEFTFSASRSGGAGGQNVNKVNTKVELRFTISSSSLLNDYEKEILSEKLANKLTTEGELIIVSQTERTQLGNKQKCIEKFYKTISRALKVDKKRTPTKPTKASRIKRMNIKRIQSDKKEMRKKPPA
ncbi:MAG: aminoacyl-tRNA hydrolase [Bacteroidetes bacterium HGW-Bacteroidetes-15]|nr:MAG: aminoacyl-tRNA hydrolase [Bacteroidetes bacterium HGW-Bacteroidetes-15]